MNNILEQLEHCIEYGKINLASPYPPDMKGQKGADELAREALTTGHPASEILEKGLMPGMQKVGVKFRENKVFVPQVLMSAKAMHAAMAHLKPYFQSGEAARKGKFVIGTVSGDLHDIGKNLVAMMIEGAGWEVVDLGVDVAPSRLLEAIDQNPGCLVGLSALLTTTMINMAEAVKEIKASHPEQKILVGGAPLTDQFRKEIGADFYSPDPQGAVEYLRTIRP
jgi:methanogenic corrinoid protein MtbC1